MMKKQDNMKLPTLPEVNEKMAYISDIEGRKYQVLHESGESLDMVKTMELFKAYNPDS